MLSRVTIPAVPLSIDLGGAEVRFENGAFWASPTPKPHLTTTSEAGIKRKQTKLIVADTTGVQVGDMMQIEAPKLLWTTGTPLRHTYRVSDVDPATREVWIEGRAAGDVSAEQVAASGKGGGIVVRFYRTVPYFRLANCRLTSPNGTSNDVLARIQGYDRVIFENVDIYKPLRTGVAVNFNTMVDMVGCSVGEHGYKEGDQGSAGGATNFPEGLGFGYGFVVSNAWLGRTSHCMSTSGWRGWDFAQGCTIGLVSDHLASKDGISTHQGNIVLDVQGGRFLGGYNLGSQSSEVYVTGARFDTSLGHVLNTHGMAHKIVLRDLEIDLAHATGNAVPFAITGTNGYAAHLFTMSEAPQLTLRDVSVSGVTGAGTLQTRGRLTVDGLHLEITPGTTRDTAMNAKSLAPGQQAHISRLTAESSGGQYPLTLDGFSKVTLRDSAYRGTPGYATSSALCAVMSSSGPVTVTATGCQVEGVLAVVAARTAGVTLSAFGCTSLTGGIVSAISTVAAQTTIREAVHNRHRGSLAPTGSTVTFESGNVVLPA